MTTADSALERPETPAAMAELFETPHSELWRWDPAKREEVQLRMARHRFETQMPRIAQLAKLAQLQKVTSVDRLDDLAPLLFRHTVYKSYPISLVTRGRFDMMTKWLDGLTVHDLSAVDASDCNSFDSWFVSLEAQSPIRPIHSTGTTGKLSIMPRGTWETEFFAHQFVHAIQPLGDGPDPMQRLREANAGGPVPIVHPSYRHGRHLAQRMMDALVSGIGSEQTTYVLNTDYLSADLMSLVGQVRGATQRGELDQLEIAPELLEKFRAMVSGQEQEKQKLKVFFERLVDELLGQAVYVVGVTPHLYDWMLRGEERGIKQLFAPESIVSTGGGAKGLDLPPDWKKRIERFIGAPMRFGYGMSESLSGAMGCEHGRYHAPVSSVLFILDLETGEPLPREGTQTGRHAFLDLNTDSYWGGFVTGDKVTVTWDGCECGRRGPWFHPEIERLSEAQGGDDKVSCSGSADAHQEATDWLIAQSGGVG
jgi:hypothetical protein